MTEQTPEPTADPAAAQPDPPPTATPDEPLGDASEAGQDEPDPSPLTAPGAGQDEPDPSPLPPPDPQADQPDPPPLTPPDPQEAHPDPDPFADGPPPLPRPMLVLDGPLPDQPDEDDAEPEDHGTCASCGGAYDEDGWCTQCGERKPDPRHHFTDQPAPHVAGVCDRGRRHTDNEDAMAVWADPDDPDDPARTVLVVCDGVTTASRSAEASLAASEAAVEVLRRAGAPAATRMVQAADAASAAVDRVGEDHPGSAPSCTFVAGIVEDGTLTVGSVGDSRGYWLPDEGEPLRLTRDDSMAEEQVEAGVDRATAESGPMAHTITRWLGPDAPDHTPRTATQDVGVPGWVLLCSDGLWNYASDPADLAAVVRAERGRAGDDPLALALALVAWANEQGGADNITVALARTGGTRQDGAHG